MTLDDVPNANVDLKAVMSRVCSEFAFSRVRISASLLLCLKEICPFWTVNFFFGLISLPKKLSVFGLIFVT